MKLPTKGFLAVGTNKNNFYIYATNILAQIKDYYPDARTCLVTDEEFVDSRVDDVDDLILTDEESNGHYRAKLWGMAKSPYDITMYVDADMGCEHEDISKAFDDLKDRDMVFPKLTDERSKYYSVYKFKDNDKDVKYRWCGGVCLYNSANPLVREFMWDWWSYYKQQYAKTWKPENLEPWGDLWIFDQTTLWWLLEKTDKYKDLNVGAFTDDLRWNYFSQYPKLGLSPENPVVLRHFSATLKKDTPIV